MTEIQKASSLQISARKQNSQTLQGEHNCTSMIGSGLVRFNEHATGFFNLTAKGIHSKKSTPDAKPILCPRLPAPQEGPPEINDDTEGTPL